MMMLEDDCGYKTGQEEEGAVQASPLPIQPETLGGSEDEKPKDKKAKKKWRLASLLPELLLLQ